jgi:hypothetical protein
MGVAAGLQLKGGQLVCLIPHLQGEVMQGTLQKGVGAVVERLDGHDITVSLEASVVAA